MNCIKSAMFYLLDNDNKQDNLSAVEQLACYITAEYWRRGKYILIFCEDERQAVAFDEALWEKPQESFVPHNLGGEGPKGGSPVEIIWSKKYSSGIHDVFVNLCSKFTDFSTTFKKVVDFVPYGKSSRQVEKQLARERYKEYRSAGFKLNTAIWDDRKNI